LFLFRQFFNNAQREATKDAAKLAGLNVLQLINGATAAAIASCLAEAKTEEGVGINVLVLDLGGSSLNVSIVNLVRGVFQVMGTACDPHLGGRDFDSRLVDYAINEIKAQHGRDFSDDKKFLRKLKTECERAKMSLSGVESAEIVFELDDEEEKVSITLNKFDELCSDLFQRTIDLARCVLKDARMEIGAIHHVIQAGSGGAIKIYSLLQVCSQVIEGMLLNVITVNVISR
jgi:heat shock protein 1/8